MTHPRTVVRLGVSKPMLTTTLTLLSGVPFHTIHACIFFVKGHQLFSDDRATGGAHHDMRWQDVDSTFCYEQRAGGGRRGGRGEDCLKGGYKCFITIKGLDESD